MEMQFPVGDTYMFDLEMYDDLADDEPFTTITVRASSARPTVIFVLEGRLPIFSDTTALHRLPHVRPSVYQVWHTLTGIIWRFNSIDILFRRPRLTFFLPEDVKIRTVGI